MTKIIKIIDKDEKLLVNLDNIAYIHTTGYRGEVVLKNGMRFDYEATAARIFSKLIEEINQNEDIANRLEETISTMVDGGFECDEEFLDALYSFIHELKNYR